MSGSGADELDELEEFLRELVASRLVEMRVDLDGEIRYCRAEGFSDVDWWRAGMTIADKGGLDA